jgi:hypothetical protein
MKKKRAAIIIILATFFSAYSLNANAGTWAVGLKGWYTSWDSSVLGWFEKDIEALFAKNGVLVDVEKDPGSGYLAGPVIGYQTENGELSISFAAMVFSRFNQSLGMETGQMGEIKADADLDRKDFDFAVTYSLFKYRDKFPLFQYQNVFVGYKHQIANLDLKITFDTIGPTKASKYKVDQTARMPTIGTGFAFPISDKAAAGCQLGLLYVIPELEKTDDDGSKDHIWTQSSFGFNGEVSLSYLPFTNLIFQLGYRYQSFTLTAILSDGGGDETKSPDITHGLTFSLVYFF